MSVKALIRIVVAAGILHASGGAAAAQPSAPSYRSDWHTLRVPGAARTLLDSAGISTSPSAPFVLGEVARALYEGEPPAERVAAVLAVFQRARQLPVDSSFEVPLPMSPATWASVIFERRVDQANLAEAILTDRRAALMYLGFLYADRRTSAFLESNPTVLRRIYREAPQAFAIYSTALVIDSGRVLVPGGGPAASIWQKLVGQPPSEPAKFLPVLLTRDEGRLAAFFDLVGALDDAQVPFVLASASRLYTFLTAYPAVQWMPTVRPRAALALNPGTFLAQLAMAPDGRPAGVLSRTFWEGVFAIDPRGTPNLTSRGDNPLDAAWLIERILLGASDGRDARNRFDTFLFAQRVWPVVSAADAADTLTALRGFARFPMLLLTLERMGISDPRVYAAAVRQAGRLAPAGDLRGRAMHGQFQGAIALLDRLRLSRALSADQASELLQTLLALNDSDGDYGVRLATWIDARVLPVLLETVPSGTARGPDDVILSAMAGVSSTASETTVNWEGFRYQVDVAGATFRRFKQVRVRQGSVTFAHLGEMVSLHRALSDPVGAVATLDQSRERFSVLAALPGSDSDPLRLAATRLLTDAAEELNRARPNELASKVSEIASTLATACNYATAVVLESLAYTPQIPRADLPLLLDGDVAYRHDFVGSPERQLIEDPAWARPAVIAAVNRPWHVRGSLLGLELALGSLALRGIAEGEPPVAAIWSAGDRDALAVSHAFFNPFSVDPAGHDVIAAALRRGAERERKIIEGDDDDAGLPDARVAALRWALAHDPAAVSGMVTVTELVNLGGPVPRAILDDWGAPGWPVDASLRLRAGRHRAWETLRWRPPAGSFAANGGDIPLRVAAFLSDMHLPAKLAGPILARIVGRVLDGAPSSSPSDWGSIAKFIREMPRADVEDAIAGETGGGALAPLADAPQTDP